MWRNPSESHLDGLSSSDLVDVWNEDGALFFDSESDENAEYVFEVYCTSARNQTFDGLSSNQYAKMTFVLGNNRTRRIIDRDNVTIYGSGGYSY